MSWEERRRVGFQVFSNGTSGLVARFDGGRCSAAVGWLFFDIICRRNARGFLACVAVALRHSPLSCLEHAVSKLRHFAGDESVERVYRLNATASSAKAERSGTAFRGCCNWLHVRKLNPPRTGWPRGLSALPAARAIARMAGV
jgi:hypothetical protein